MASILSLKSLSEIDGARLVIENLVKNITLILKDRASYIFNQHENGFYFLDTIKSKYKKLTYALLQTVVKINIIILNRKSMERKLHVNTKNCHTTPARMPSNIVQPIIY